MRYLFISVVSILILYYSFKKEHTYWNRQPVSTNQIKQEGVISDTVPFPIRTKKSFKIVKNNPSDVFLHYSLAKFLSEHYVKGYYFNNTIISWYLKYPELTSRNVLTLQRGNKIIASLVGKPYRLNIKGKILNLHYIDMLSVHDNHRNKNYAPLVISHSAIQFKYGVFKIENKQLPFNHVCKMKYYTYEAHDYIKCENTHILKDSTLEDLDYINSLYKKKSSKYKFYPEFDEKQMNYFFTTTNVYRSLIIEEDGINMGILTYVINSDATCKINMCEVVLFLYEGNDYINLFKRFVNHCIDNNITLIISLNISENHHFIDNFNFRKGFDTYLYLYNYHINEVIQPKDVLFNFV